MKWHQVNRCHSMLYAPRAYHFTYIFMLIISWVQVRPCFNHCMTCALQLVTRCFRAASTFMIRNHVTLKSRDFLVNTSRQHESEDKNTRHREKSITTCYAMILLSLALRMHTFWCIKTHTTCAHENTLYTHNAATCLVLPPWQKEDMFQLSVSIGLFVCLFVFKHPYSKSYTRIAMKF